jgi:hypothetical protein
MRVSALSKSYFGQSTITELIGPIIPRTVSSADDPARRVADPGLLGRGFDEAESHYIASGCWRGGGVRSLCSSIFNS